VQNGDFHLPNGVSLLAAGPFVTERTLVLMADHVFGPAMLAPLLTLSAQGEDSVLAVDRNIGAVFDLADATKVRMSGALLTDIGKRLHRFDAVDTGLFAVSPALIAALGSLDAPQLSDGVRLLAKRGLMRICDVTGGRWVDVDTQKARRHAERLLAQWGDALEAPAEGPPAFGA
jgi:choline kinase